MIAMAVGATLALLALGYVLYPLLAGTKPHDVGQSACPKCGAFTEPEASYCSSCGTALLRPEENDRFG